MTIATLSSPSPAAENIHPGPARVRFAPSPTGYLHLGGLRTALFNWLYARHTDGQFILRIEDTDQTRFSVDSLEDIMQGLRWLGLNWDEGPDVGGPYGPYIQTERAELYQQYIEQLIAAGHAYRSYMTADELSSLREEQKAKGVTQGYDRRDRHLTAQQIAAYEAEGRPSVVRLVVPTEGVTTIHDLIRGQTTWDNINLPADPVLMKSDGLPTYHFAVVVDDHLMQITHILRSDEWLSSTPIHQIIYGAFGWEMPQVAHLPVILDPSGKGKMSKRKKVVAGKEYLALVHEFIEAGYLPEAMHNFLTNIGWNFDAEREIFEPEEAIARFQLADINPAPAALPYEKLDWLNGVYIRDLAPGALKMRIAPFLSAALGMTEAELLASPKLDALIPLIRERMKRLTDVADLCDWAFMPAAEISYSDPKMLLGKKLDAAQTIAALQAGSQLMQEMPEFTSETLEAAFRAKADELELKAGSFFGPFRAAITGKTVSPPLFESMAVLGRAEVLARVQNAIAVLREI